MPTEASAGRSPRPLDEEGNPRVSDMTGYLRETEQGGLKARPLAGNPVGCAPPVPPRRGVFSDTRAPEANRGLLPDVGIAP
jgi:hypothetical protein